MRDPEPLKVVSELRRLRDGLTRAEGEKALNRLKEAYEALLCQEPPEEEEEAYDEWVEALEEIDDLMDDIQDRF